jgi:hypothetical protein
MVGSISLVVNATSHHHHTTMTTTYTWAIVNLGRRTNDGDIFTVFTAHYTVAASDGTYTSSTYGSIDLEPPAEDAIPYADLTPELVIGWVQAKLDVPAIEAALQAQLDEQAAPTKAAGLPWA